jgi:hypothetical protein
MALFFLLLGWGTLCSKILPNLWNGVTSKLVLGILSIASCSSFVAFFYPLNAIYEIFIIAIGLLGLLLNKKNFSEDLKLIKNKYVLISVGILVVIGTCAPFINDHYSYYVPTIKWLNEYGLVKGIANINLILGQQSTWHIFQASIDSFIDVFLRANIILVVIYLLYIFENKKWELLLFIPVFLLFIHSPSPDLVLYILGIIVLLETLKPNPNYANLLLIAIFLCTIKPIIFWLPLVIFIQAIRNSSPIFTFKTSLITFVILSSFFAKQLWCFGDILFPVESHLFHFSWKPNAELLQLSNKYAVLKTYDMQYSLQTIQSWNIIEKITHWFTISGFKSVIHWFIFAILVTFGLFSFYKKNKTFLIIWSCILLKTVVIFLFSGQYRFMLDGILILVVLLLDATKIKPYFYHYATIFSVSAVCIAFAFPNIVKQNISSFRSVQFMSKPTITQFMKPTEYHLSHFDTYQITNFDFFVPNDFHLLFDAPLPAFTPFSLNELLTYGIFPTAYDKNDLSKGFYVTKLSEVEALRLKTILKNYTFSKGIAE